MDQVTAEQLALPEHPPTRERERPCETCGALMDVRKAGQARRRYCSYACMGLAFSEKHRGEANPNYRGTTGKVCERCGSEYHSYSKRRRFCSQSCWARTNMTSERGAAMNAKRPPTPFKTPDEKIRRSVCRKCGMQVIGREKQTYCATCKAEIRAEQIRRLTRQCTVCGNEFLSRSATTCSRECAGVAKARWQVGDKSHRWQGGKTSKAMTVRNSREYGAWRTAVFERDDFTCNLCGERGGRLTAHHIRTFAKHPELALHVWNGITLCWPCHSGLAWKEEQYEERFFAVTGGPR